MQGVGDALRARADALIDLRRDLHRHPELSFAEHRTAALVADRLTRAGLEVTTGVAGTGVVAVVHGDKPGRTVAWRADMDALPIREAIDLPFRSTNSDVMHACGHDGHTAIAVIVGEALAAQRRELAGTLVFVFQPAEEVFGGARPMLEAGILDAHAVAEIYGMHLSSRFPAGRVEACPGTSMASADFLEIVLHGRGGHGASPHQTIDPIGVAAQVLLGLPGVVRNTVPAAGRAVLSIGQLDAGTAPNIIPELAKLRGSLRALDRGDRERLLERIEAYVASTAAAYRARGEVRAMGPSCPVLVNHEPQTAHVHACAAAELGAGCVIDGEPVLASDDMSLFLASRPGCYFRVGAAPVDGHDAPHHSGHFNIDEASLLVGARVAASVLVTAASASE